MVQVELGALIKYGHSSQRVDEISRVGRQVFDTSDALGRVRGRGAGSHNRPSRKVFALESTAKTWEEEVKGESTSLLECQNFPH
jgi:hypothetical protein